jgi:hypothetical protein
VRAAQCPHERRSGARGRSRLPNRGQPKGADDRLRIGLDGGAPLRRVLGEPNLISRARPLPTA